MSITVAQTFSVTSLQAFSKVAVHLLSTTSSHLVSYKIVNLNSDVLSIADGHKIFIGAQMCPSAAVKMLSVRKYAHSNVRPGRLKQRPSFNSHLTVNPII